MILLKNLKTENIQVKRYSISIIKKTILLLSIANCQMFLRLTQKTNFFNCLPMIMWNQKEKFYKD